MSVDGRNFSIERNIQLESIERYPPDKAAVDGGGNGDSQLKVSSP